MGYIPNRFPGWLALFADGPNATDFSISIPNIKDVVVPMICLYEVFKVVLRELSENEAPQAVALMRQGNVVDLNSELALNAPKVSMEYRIPVAHSNIFATAQAFQAPIWTQDEDFKRLPGVKFLPRKPAPGS
jgi:predicted nucleic acid-binding protein